jgi:hypothetical protein
MQNYGQNASQEFPDFYGLPCYLALDMKTHQQFMMASGNATIRHLFERTVMFVDTKDLPFERNEEWETSSGTLVAIGNRLFVATVSHSLQNLESPSRYRLMTIDGRNHPASSDVVIRTVGRDDDRPDVGFIELNPDVFHSFSTNVPIDLSRISIVPPEGQLSSLMGTPYATVKFSQNDQSEWGISATVSGFSTSAIEIDDWPNINLEIPFDPEIEMVINYPNDSPDIRDEHGNQTKLKNPHGISGGGLWIHGHVESEANTGVWTPSACKLVGIQASWIPKRGFVRLPRIPHWLDLVRDEYPDLRVQIDATFPSLNDAR